MFCVVDKENKVLCITIICAFLIGLLVFGVFYYQFTRPVFVDSVIFYSYCGVLENENNNFLNAFKIIVSNDASYDKALRNYGLNRFYVSYGVGVQDYSKYNVISDIINDYPLDDYVYLIDYTRFSTDGYYPKPVKVFVDGSRLFFSESDKPGDFDFGSIFDSSYDMGVCYIGVFRKADFELRDYIGWTIL